MSLTATMSSSACASYAARNRLRPILPKPLIPTFTGAIWRTLLDRSVAGNRDFYPMPVGIPKVRRVVTRTVSRPRPRRAVVGAPGLEPPLVGGLHGRNRVGGEAHMA